MSEYPDILTLEQAADYLQISSRTIQRLVKEGRVPGRQVGSQWRFDREQLRAWIQGKGEARGEPTTQAELIERESARLGVDRPETLIELQQEAVRRHARRADKDPS